MDQKILARYNDSVLQEAMQRYGIAKHEIQPLDAFESFIYEFERGGKGFILRIGHSLRKSENLLVVRPRPPRVYLPSRPRSPA